MGIPTDAPAERPYRAACHRATSLEVGLRPRSDFRRSLRRRPPGCPSFSAMRCSFLRFAPFGFSPFDAFRAVAVGPANVFVRQPCGGFRAFFLFTLTFHRFRFGGRRVFFLMTHVFRCGSAVFAFLSRFEFSCGSPDFFAVRACRWVHAGKSHMLCGAAPGHAHQQDERQRECRVPPHELLIVSVLPLWSFRAERRGRFVR